MEFNDCKTTIDIKIPVNNLGFGNVCWLKHTSNIYSNNNSVSCLVQTFDCSYNIKLENNILYIYCVNYYKAHNIINKVYRALVLPGFITQYQIWQVRTYIPPILLTSNSILVNLRGQYITANSINEVKQLYEQLKMVHLMPNILNYLHKQTTSIFHYIPYDIIICILALNQF